MYRAYLIGASVWEVVEALDLGPGTKPLERQGNILDVVVGDSQSDARYKFIKHHDLDFTHPVTQRFIEKTEHDPGIVDTDHPLWEKAGEILASDSFVIKRLP